jgi:hypothetical protein
VFFYFYSSTDLLCICFAVLHPLSGLFPRPHRVELLTRPSVGLGTGRFRQVSAHSATQPMLIGFGQFQPTMNSKKGKSVGYSGRTDRVCAGGLVGWVGLNASSLIFSHLSRFHLLHCLPAISLKPTNPTLTPPSLLMW